MEKDSKLISVTTELMEEVTKRLPPDLQLPQALPYWPPELRGTFQ